MKRLTDCDVLVVDDSLESLMVLESVLDGLCHVHTATSGDEALQRAPLIRPDLVLLDVMMPGNDGFVTCRALKAAPETEHTPVIFLTGLSMPRDKLNGFSAGAVDYVTKPFDGMEIRARVKNHLLLSLYEQDQRRHIEVLSGAVRDSEETYLFFANHTTDVLVQCSPEGTIRRVNRSWTELTGLAGGLPIGRPLWDFVIPQDATLLRSSFEQGIAEGRKDMDLKFRVATADGQRIVRGAFRVCYSSGGDVVGLNGVLSDVTELVEAKEGLEDALVSGRRAAASHLNYLENISHEIRTPLHMLEGGLQRFRDLPLDADSREALRLVEDGTRGLSALLENLLAADQRTSRASSGVFQTGSGMRREAGPDVAVLIVDDIKANRHIMSHVMKALGFPRCDVAESGEEALALWDGGRHDLILLDYKMGGMDGYETCRHLRSRAGHLKPTILGVSASALPENLDRALQAGFSGQIPKPFSIPLLRQTLENLGWKVRES